MDYLERRQQELLRNCRSERLNLKRTRRRLRTMRENVHGTWNVIQRFQYVKESRHVRKEKKQAEKRMLECERLVNGFDPNVQREANKDVGLGCRFRGLDDSFCGKPTVEGTCWCADHINLWSENGEHAVLYWRRLYFPYKRTPLNLSQPVPMSRADACKAAKESYILIRYRLEDEGQPLDSCDNLYSYIKYANRYGLLHEFCTEEDIRRWCTPPVEED